MDETTTTSTASIAPAQAVRAEPLVAAFIGEAPAAVEDPVATAAVEGPVATVPVVPELPVALVHELPDISALFERVKSAH